MIFNSTAFLIFLSFTAIIYYLLPAKIKKILILVASLIFYASFNYFFVLILLPKILIDYICAIFIEKSPGTKRTYYLIISLFTNLGLLFVFKYLNFFNANIASVLKIFNFDFIFPVIKLIAPIGLSFQIFQSISYIIEVYRKKYPAERNIINYILYVIFFPQIVSGPIGRPQNLIHQFNENHYLDYTQIINGLRMILWGLFKKMVIADRIAIMVNFVYLSPNKFNGLILLLTAYIFTIQIYCDFSGYTDIAIGSAQILGYKLPRNFNQPYFATSITNFWERWHITLSEWFRDYVYIPLGGNRIVKIIWIRNILIVFMLSGLWHGASWTFIIWGLLHGLGIIIPSLFKKFYLSFYKIKNIATLSNFKKALNIFITFNYISLTWIFFRSSSLNQTFNILKIIFRDLPNLFNLSILKNFINTNIGLNRYEILTAIAFILPIAILNILQNFFNISFSWNKQPLWIRWSMYYIIILAIIFFGEYGNRNFIYSQF